MQASGQASFSQLTSKAANLLRMRGATLLYVASAVSCLRLNTGLTASPPISLPIIHQQLLSFRNVSQR